MQALNFRAQGKTGTAEHSSRGYSFDDPCQVLAVHVWKTSIHVLGKSLTRKKGLPAGHPLPPGGSIENPESRDADAREKLSDSEIVTHAYIPCVGPPLNMVLSNSVVDVLGIAARIVQHRGAQFQG